MDGGGAWSGVRGELDGYEVWSGVGWSHGELDRNLVLNRVGWNCGKVAKVTGDLAMCIPCSGADIVEELLIPQKIR